MVLSTLSFFELFCIFFFSYLIVNSLISLVKTLGHVSNCIAYDLHLLIMQTKYPTLARVNEAYEETPAFRDALPENQPDATS